jgi:hypothetical protein
MSMEYNLGFWKDAPRSKGKKPPKPSTVYDKLDSGKHVDGVEALPTEQILDRLVELFPDFEPESQFAEINLQDGGIGVMWGPQHFRFELRGEADKAAGQIITMMNEEFGCPLYDAEDDKRYRLNERTPWHATPEERAAAERELEDLAADLSKQFTEMGKQQEATRAEREAELARTDPEYYALIKPLQDKHDESKRKREAEQAALEARLAPIIEWLGQARGDEVRWRRLRFEPRRLATALDSWAAVLAWAEPAPGKSPRFSGQTPADEWLDYVPRRINAGAALMTLRFLEAVPPGYALPASSELAAITASEAQRYFSDSWREGCLVWPGHPHRTAAQMRTDEYMGWYRHYRHGLLAVLAGDHDAVLTDLLRWPDTDLPLDDESGDATSSDNKVHIYLATRLRTGGAEDAKTTELAQAVRTAKRPRAAGVLQAAEALFAGDAKAFQKGLERVLTQWRDKSLDKTRPERADSVDGSILWHLARRHGLALPKLPQRLEDVVLR